MHNGRKYFIIVERLSRIQPVYRLKDLNNQQLKGVFYEYQLQKIAPGGLYPISKVLKYMLWLAGEVGMQLILII